MEFSEEDKSFSQSEEQDEMNFGSQERLESQNDEFNMGDNTATELAQRTFSERSFDNLDIKDMTNSKFDQMIQDIANEYRIPHYGDQIDLNKFEVIKPTLIRNKYVAYHVRGEDNLGQFDGMRRYNEFHMLRSTLILKWPGVYVPSLPPKKAVGNKDVKFIIERRYFLERFLKQISQHPHLLNSEEFRIFARPEFTGGNSDIQGQLLKLNKLSYEELGKRFYEGFGITEMTYREMTDRQQEYEEKITEFENFLKKLLIQYKNLRKQIKGLAEIKANQISNQKSLINVLQKYEEKSLHYYVEGNQSKMILGDSTNDLYKQLKEMAEKMKNPFNNLYYWVKGEILDVTALQEAINHRTQILVHIQKITQRRQSQANELEKLMGGRTSLKTLFKSSNEKQNYQLTLQKQIESTEKQIDGLIMMGIILDWQLGEITLPNFKKEKINNFSYILREMSSIEVDNSNIGATHWSKVLSNSNLKHF